MDSASDEEPEGTAVIEDVDEWIDEWARLQGLEEDWLDTLRPPPAPTSPAPARPKQTGRATFELRGAGAHASIVNGEYLEDTSWTHHLVFTNKDDADMFMWAVESAGRWCIGRRKNVGTGRCRAFVDSEAMNPEEIAIDAVWWLHDGSTDGSDAAYSPSERMCMRTIQTAGGHSFKQRPLPLHSAPPKMAAVFDLLDAEIASRITAAWPAGLPVAQLHVSGCGAWGPKCNEALRDCLATGSQVATVCLQGIIYREHDFVQLIQSLDGGHSPTKLQAAGQRLALAKLAHGRLGDAALDAVQAVHADGDVLELMGRRIVSLLPLAGLQRLIVSHNRVGIVGLRTLLAAARRCPTLRCTSPS